MMTIQNYTDAIYHVKRGFLILGLTGYTGSGCSTARDILRQNEKPRIPSFELAFKNQQTVINERIYNKLKREYDAIEWKSFKAIEVSKVIFALAVNEALFSKKNNNEIEVIRKLTKEDNSKLHALKFLTNSESLNLREAEALITAYKACVRKYNPFRKQISQNDVGKFIELMQNYGDKIRKYGEVFPADDNVKPSPEKLFILPEAIRRLIKAYRVIDKTLHSHFVIDAFRNPYEVEYFKRRYAEFYLVGILRSAMDRHGALRGNKLSEQSIEELDEKEHGNSVQLSKDNIGNWIASLNIEKCLQKADFFIENVPDISKTYPSLRFNLIKLITLAKNPGCIPPTDDERGMQIAMTARQMARCISRQVGAVVFNKKGYVVGIGWNDPPEGQIPCSLRTGKELVDSPREEVFSEFERSEQFVKHIKGRYYPKDLPELPFCFRNELPIVQGKQGEKMAEYTRSLHAEENAFFQAVWNTGGKLDGATLYTTDSTCTLCAKKAYQLGIKRIVYIDEYPGISVNQTIRTGNRKIVISRFEGVTGSAYFRLFSLLMPEKDFIQLFLMEKGLD